MSLITPSCYPSPPLFVTPVIPIVLLLAPNSLSKRHVDNLKAYNVVWLTIFSKNDNTPMICMSICIWDIHKRRSHILQLHLQKGGYDMSESVDMRIKKSGLHVYLQEENREHYHCCCNKKRKRALKGDPFSHFTPTREIFV